MKNVLAHLTIKELEIEEEIERLTLLKGHPNEKLRQSSLKSNQERLQEYRKAKEILITNWSQ